MKTRRYGIHRWGIALLAAAAAVFAAGCAGYRMDSVDDRGDLYHHNWWNHYARGITFLKAGETEKARSDFEICLGLRRGAKYGFPTDMWRARTYGLHFLEEYFPNRELGICLYQLGETGTAIEFLEKSLDQEPSGRAKHYLNLARKKRLAEQRIAPPEISFDPACKGIWTRLRSRRISGTARGKGLVRQILVNRRPLFIELAEEEVAFSKELSLKPGTNLIAVTANDLLDRPGTRELVWIADWRTPELLIRKMARQGEEWILEGTCYDDFGIAAVTIDGVIRFAGNGAPRKGVPVTIKFRAGQQPVFVAEDIAGNRLETSIEPGAVKAAAVRPCGPDQAQYVYWNGCRRGGTLWRNSGPARPSIGSTMYELALLNCDGVLDTGVTLLAALAGQTSPATPDPGPILALSDPRDVIKVFDKEVLVDGSASASDGLRSIRINDSEILPQARQGAIRTYFAHRLPLREGENTVDIIVIDRKGVRKARRLKVIYTPPEYMNKEFRLTMVFPPLPSEESVPRKHVVRRLIESALLRDPVRFHVLEREEGWDFILRELKLSVSELADPRLALRVDKLLHGDMILVASLILHDPGLTIYARVIDTNTREVIFDTDVYTEAVEADLPYQVDGLVMKIEQRFPLLTGDVSDVSGRTAVISIGSDDGLCPNARFVVARNPAARDIHAGKVRRFGKGFVELRTKRVGRRTGTVKILPGSARDSVKEGDYVYAR